jgi:hypothetical protein
MCQFPQHSSHLIHFIILSIRLYDVGPRYVSVPLLTLCMVYSISQYILGASYKISWFAVGPMFIKPRSPKLLYCMHTDGRERRSQAPRENVSFHIRKRKNINLKIKCHDSGHCKSGRKLYTPTFQYILTAWRGSSSKIWGFHGGDYDECRLLGCGAV